MKTKKERWDTIGDFIICIAVFAQPALILLQHLLASVGGLELEQTTIYRVALTVVLLVPAMLVTIYRKPVFFISCFIAIAFVLLLTIFIFPENKQIISDQAFRFLVPVVVPSFVCIVAVHDFNVIKTSIRIIGWSGAFGAVLFLLLFLMGRFSVDRYSMFFSYACLFPMLVLFSQKRALPVIISIIIFLEVLAFGSRGAAVVFAFYMVLDLVRQKGKMRMFVILGGVLLVVIFPYFVQYLDQIGVSSRTIILLLNGGFTESEGRDLIYEKAITTLFNNPITGVGIYGDRVTFGAYCHNIILEILVDFGLIIGSLFLFLISYIIIIAFKISSNDVHEVAVILLFFGVMPHMISGSYLTEPYFALFMGYCVWIINNKKKVHPYAALKKTASCQKTAS